MMSPTGVAEGPTIKVFLPEGHPLAGSEIVMWPDNGATSYTDGRVVFTTPLQDQLRQGLQALRDLVAETRAKARP